MVDWCCMKIAGKLSVLIFFKPNKLALSQYVMQDEFYGQLEQLENSRGTGELFQTYLVKYLRLALSQICVPCRGKLYANT